jgi:hypothetical protein
VAQAQPDDLLEAALAVLGTTAVDDQTVHQRVRLRPGLRKLTLLEDGGHLPVERPARHRLAEVLITRLCRGQELRNCW